MPSKSKGIGSIIGYATQHLQYLPYGELFINQQSSTFDSRYKFSAKELDDETGYNYFGARYLDTELSVWLSVDPLSMDYPSTSPFMYVLGNPIRLIDPNGLYHDENKANKAHDKAVKKYGADRVGDVHNIGTNGKSNYVFDVYGKGKDKYTHPADGGVMAYKPDAIISNNKDIKGFERTNKIQTINTIATALGLFTDFTKEAVQIPKVGYYIAFNNTLLKGVSYLKPLSYALSIISVGSDLNLSYNGQQSWAETGANTVVTGASIAAGSWVGVLIQANYQASKAYMKMLKEHPEWAPYPYRGFNH